MRGILVVFMMFFISGCSFLNLNQAPTNNHQSVETKLRQIAKEWQNTPYVLGKASVKGADCSGFTQSVLAKFNKKIPRTTKTQLNSGVKISKPKLRAGDLVFFKTNRGPNGMHVGIYTSNAKFIHLSTKGGVKEVELNNAYWKTRYFGARRYL